MEDKGQYGDSYGCPPGHLNPKYPLTKKIILKEKQRPVMVGAPQDPPGNKVEERGLVSLGWKERI